MFKFLTYKADQVYVSIHFGKFFLNHYLFFPQSNVYAAYKNFDSFFYTLNTQLFSLITLEFLKVFIRVYYFMLRTVL